MKNFIATALICTSVTACTPAWWSELKTNPTAAVTTLEQEIAPYLAAAEAIFEAAVTLLPVAQSSTVQQSFAAAVTAVNDAEKALNDAVAAAAQAESSNPDFTTLTNALVDAVAQVQAVIDSVKTLIGKEPVGYSSLSSSNSSIAKFKHVTVIAPAPSASAAK